VTCAKCGRPIADNCVRVAIMLGDGRAALDWQCFETVLRPGRASELMRLSRDMTERSRTSGAPAAVARGERYQGEPE